MSDPKTSVSIEEQRARLEIRANAIRSRLFRTMDALDNRRHQVTELGHQAKKLAMPFAAGILGLAVVAAGTAYAIGAAVERRREKSLGYRFSRALVPLQQKAHPPLWSEAMRKIVMAAVGIAATHLLKQGVQKLDALHAENQRGTTRPQLSARSTS